VWPPFASIEPPCLPHPIDVTEGDSNLPLRFRYRMEHQATWTGRIVVEQLPQKGLVRFRHLSSSIQCWFRVVNGLPLDSLHALVLLKDQDGTFPHSSQCLFFMPMKSESWLNNCQTVSGVRRNYTLPKFLEKLHSRTDVDAWCEALLHAVATHDVGNRPDRVEPRVKKRRPKPYKLMQQPRAAYKSIAHERLREI